MPVAKTPKLKPLKKPLKEDTWQALVDAGTEIILEKGFNNTGIEQVLKAVGVPKGSFYYYFKSKEDFGLTILNLQAQQLQNGLLTIHLNKHLSPLERLRLYFEEGRSRIESNACRKGCLIGNLGQEMADQNETFRLRLAQIFAEWRDVISQCLQDAQAQNRLPKRLQPEALAEYLLFSWEGAILRCKMTKSLDPIDHFLRFVFDELLVSDD